jgi:hypothetical protein
MITHTDAAGKPISGAGGALYTVTFKEPPPVSGFASLTPYNSTNKFFPVVKGAPPRTSVNFPGAPRAARCASPASPRRRPSRCPPSSSPPPPPNPPTRPPRPPPIPAPAGSAAELQKGADGSLTLYLSASPPPAPAPASNWLAIGADGPSYLILRLYGPSKEAIAGGWQPPAVVKAT